MTEVPTAFPVTTPDASTLAIALFDVPQTPPDVELESDKVEPLQTLDPPPITATEGMEISDIVTESVVVPQALVAVKYRVADPFETSEGDG